MRALLAALAAFLLSVPAFAGPIAGYPYASTPYNASDAPVGTQNNATVQFTMANIAAYAQSSTPVWNVQTKFGAYGNTINYADGAINATTSAFSSNNANFTSADIGKSICVDGSGAAGAYQCGTITGYTSAHGVTVSFTAATSVTGANYYYGNDDGPTIYNAITAANVSAGSTAPGAGPGATSGPNIPVCLYFPPGVYGVFSQTFPLFYRNGCVIGAAPEKSIIFVGAQYNGTVFSWSDSWSAAVLPISGALAGGSITNITIDGDLTATNTQIAVGLYDIVDFFRAQSLHCNNLHGQCLTMGKVVQNTGVYQMGNAIVRESVFYDLSAFFVGTSTLPAIDINAAGGSDSTNELKFYGVNVYGCPGVCVAFRNYDASNPLRYIEMFGLRTEYSTGGDLVEFGDGIATGSMYGIDILGYECNSSPTSYACLHFQAASGGGIPSHITVTGKIPLAAGNGINVQAGQYLQFHFSEISTTGTNVVVGSSSQVSAPILFDGAGAETGWTYSVNSAAYSKVAVPLAITCHNAGLC